MLEQIVEAEQIPDLNARAIVSADHAVANSLLNFLKLLNRIPAIAFSHIGKSDRFQRHALLPGEY